MSSIVLDVRTLGGHQIACFEPPCKFTVTDVLQQLIACGEYRISSLVFGEIQLASSSPIDICAFADGRHVINAIFRSKEWLEDTLGASTAKKLMRTDFDSCKNRDVATLRHVAYTGRELRASGFSPMDFRPCFNDIDIPTFTLRSCDFSVMDMLRHGFVQSELKQHGFTVRDFVESGIKATRELMKAGFTALDFLAGGYTVAQLQELSFSAKILQQAGCWPAQLREAGYSAKDLKMAGFSLAQLKEGGYTLLEFKTAGYATWVIARSGYTLKQLADVGCTPDDLAAAGYIIPAAKCPVRASRAGKL